MRCLGNQPLVGQIELSPTGDADNPKDSPLRKELNAMKEQLDELTERVKSLEEANRYYHGGNSDDE